MADSPPNTNNQFIQNAAKSIQQKTTLPDAVNGTFGSGSQPGTSSPGGAYVWSDDTLKVGPIDTGIHTRVLKDIAVVGISVALLITGLILIAKPDLSQLAKSATAILPEVAA